MAELFPFLNTHDAVIYAKYKHSLAEGVKLRSAAAELNMSYATFLNECARFRALESIHNGTFRLMKEDIPILDGLSLGDSYREIAPRVYRSEDWVKKRAQRLQAAFEAKNLRHLVRRAYELGMLKLKLSEGGVGVDS